MEKTRWIIFLAVVVVLFGGLITWSRLANPPVDTSDVDKSIVLSASEMSGNIGDQVRGNKNSSVVFVEYADFQCPSCKSAHPQVNELVAEYGDRVAFVFRNYPLTSIHPNAQAAAGAAEAAGLQGKYWDMHEVIFDKQTEWSSLDASKRTDAFRSYAMQLGLDPEQFVTDLSSQEVKKKIAFDVLLATDQGVNATPTFLVNGKPVDDGAAANFVNGDASALFKTLDEQLAKE